MAFYENTIIARQDLAEKEIKDIVKKYNEIINNSSGKGMKIAPFAKLDDGLIDLLVVRNVKRLKLLSLFTKIFNGDHIKDAKVEYFTTKQLSIKSEKEYPLNIDGDNKETSPITIQVRPKEIEIFN